MNTNKFYKKLSCIGLALALAFLPGCSSHTTAFQETTTSGNVTAAVQHNEGAKTESGQSVTDSSLTAAQFKESQIHFIDTGNSDAILIINDGEAMLVDGGDNDDEDFLVNYLKNQGITELEYLIATHPHADHVGGLDAVVTNLHVNTIFVANGDADSKTYTDFINAAMNKGLTPSVPLEDSKFSLGSGYFRVMNTGGGSTTNNESLVVEYVNGEDKVLLMGDAEEEVEKEILSKLDKVDLLKVGHHGSRTSTSQAFLEKVNPEYAVITCGTGNSYGHPHKETMDKLAGIEVHRTDECGSIIFKSTGHGLTTDCSTGDLKTGGTETRRDDEEKAGRKDQGTESKTAGSSTGKGAAGSKAEESSQGKATGSKAEESSQNQSAESKAEGSSQSQSAGSKAEESSQNQSAESKAEAGSQGQNAESKAESSTTGQTSDTSTKTVYWTPNGKSYHSTDQCPTLSRSKTILSGTISESGKDDPCDRCYK